MPNSCLNQKIFPNHVNTYKKFTNILGITYLSKLGVILRVMCICGFEYAMK